MCEMIELPIYHSFCSPLLCLLCRFFSPLGMAPVVGLVGLGLFQRGFPAVCVVMKFDIFFSVGIGWFGHEGVSFVGISKLLPRIALCTLIRCSYDTRLIPHSSNGFLVCQFYFYFLEKVMVFILLCYFSVG